MPPAAQLRAQVVRPLAALVFVGRGIDRLLVANDFLDKREPLLEAFLQAGCIEHDVADVFQWSLLS